MLLLLLLYVEDNIINTYIKGTRSKPITYKKLLRLVKQIIYILHQYCFIALLIYTITLYWNLNLGHLLYIFRLDFAYELPIIEVAEGQIYWRWFWGRCEHNINLCTEDIWPIKGRSWLFCSTLLLGQPDVTRLHFANTTCFKVTHS